MKKTNLCFNRKVLLHTIPIASFLVFLLTASLQLPAREPQGKGLPAADTKHVYADIRVSGRVLDTAGTRLPGCGCAEALAWVTKKMAAGALY